MGSTASSPECSIAASTHTALTAEAGPNRTSPRKDAASPVSSLVTLIASTASEYESNDGAREPKRSTTCWRDRPSSAQAAPASARDVVARMAPSATVDHRRRSGIEETIGVDLP